MKYFFTYGSEGHPYKGGWSTVEAPTWSMACHVFALVHPNGPDGYLACCSVYTEQDFMRTKMLAVGNLGAFCHENIKLTVETVGDEEN